MDAISNVPEPVNEPVLLIGTASGGTPPYEFEWTISRDPGGPRRQEAILRTFPTTGPRTLTLTVTDETKVRRNGKTTGLVATDRVLVQARVCKADLANEATPTLTAVRVVAHPAKA